MAGRVVVSTLNDDTGVLNTQNGMTGIAKAWINFNGTGTPAIRSSFNVSSITDNGTGDYTLNFTTAMPNANYTFTSAPASYRDNTGVCVGVKLNVGNDAPELYTTTQLRIQVVAANFNEARDLPFVGVAVFSS